MQTMYDTESAQDTRFLHDLERKLWSEYLVMLARKTECWRLYNEAWRNYVTTGLDDAVKGRVWDKCSSLHDMWRERAECAYREWQKIAYPLHNIALSDEEARDGAH